MPVGACWHLQHGCSTRRHRDRLQESIEDCRLVRGSFHFGQSLRIADQPREALVDSEPMLLHPRLTIPQGQPLARSSPIRSCIYDYLRIEAGVEGGNYGKGRRTEGTSRSQVAMESDYVSRRSLAPPFNSPFVLSAISFLSSPLLSSPLLSFPFLFLSLDPGRWFWQ